MANASYFFIMLPSLMYHLLLFTFALVLIFKRYMGYCIIRSGREITVIAHIRILPLIVEPSMNYSLVRSAASIFGKLDYTLVNIRIEPKPASFESSLSLLNRIEIVIGSEIIRIEFVYISSCLIFICHRIKATLCALLQVHRAVRCCGLKPRGHSLSWSVFTGMTKHLNLSISRSYRYRIHDLNYADPVTLADFALKVAL